MTQRDTLGADRCFRHRGHPRYLVRRFPQKLHLQDAAVASSPTAARLDSGVAAGRRILHRHGSAPDLGEFTRIGLLTAPAGLVLAVLALWATLQVVNLRLTPRGRQPMVDVWKTHQCGSTS